MTETSNGRPIAALARRTHDRSTAATENLSKSTLSGRAAWFDINSLSIDVGTFASRVGEPSIDVGTFASHVGELSIDAGAFASRVGEPSIDALELSIDAATRSFRVGELSIDAPELPFESFRSSIEEADTRIVRERFSRAPKRSLLARVDSPSAGTVLI
jgi:hypothetical protein